jgi:hypothetical protein
MATKEDQKNKSLEEMNLVEVTFWAGNGLIIDLF